MNWRILIPALCLTMPVSAASCDSLMKLALPGTKIMSATAVGSDLAPGMRRGHSAPFCRVSATLTPSADSDIHIEVWLPESGWNGKYLAVGNGGWSGSINSAAMLQSLQRGYATSSTDTGHNGGSAEFAMGHPEKLIDYAYRSEHEMTVAAKAIIAAYYGSGPKLSYWNGCSAGGKQALKEAQKFPTDFDGIVAGSPAANWVGRATQAIWVAQAMHRNEASYIPPSKYPVIHKAALAVCDRLDGVEDGVLETPRACTFDPNALRCKSGDGPDCLTGPQVEAAQAVYGHSINPRTGKAIYPGLERGSELGWQTWGGPRPLGIATDHYRFVVFGKPEWDFRSLDFDRDVTRAQELDNGLINALDPDLRPFFAHGGKLIQYHGWNDPQISPGNSVDYYTSVLEKLGGASAVSDSYRLFMVPGMAHCGGGEGTSTFDMVAPLEQWREQKKAPDQIIASRVRDGKTDRTRPLCPYPQVAIYKGTGSIDDATSFTCGRSTGVQQ